MTIEWKGDPTPPHDVVERIVNGGAKADVDLAFQDGVVVDYEKRVIDGPRGVSDLEIRIVFRHKSVLREEEAPLQTAPNQ